MATIDDYKKAYDTAKARNDTKGMTAAHAGAESIRASQGFSGGEDGSQYIPLAGANVAVPAQNVPQSLAVNTTVNPAVDTQAKMQAMQDAARQRLYAGFDKSKNAALSNISAERTKVQPRFSQARNDVAVQGQMQAQNFAEYIANRGLRNSGENDQARLMQNVGLQNQIGGLRQQESQAYTDLDRRTTDVENAYQSDMSAAEAGLQSDYLKNTIDQYNQDRNYGVNMAGITGVYDGQRTLAGQQFDWNRSPSNPENKARALAISIDQIKLSNLPETLKLEAEKLRQEVAAGRLAPEKAQAEIDKIKAETRNVGASTALGWANLNASNQEKAYQHGQDALTNSRNTQSDATGLMEKAIDLASKDTVFFLRTPGEQQKRINTIYDQLKNSSAMTDEGIKKFLK